MRMKVVMIALAAGAGLATLQGATAEAQWDFLEPPGMWWYYGSVHGCATITKVPNPDTHPAFLRCDVKITEVETLCDNPGGNQVPGEAATQIVFSGQGKFNLSDLDQKYKGRANKCLGIDDTFLGHNELCVNPNWTLVDWLTMKFEAVCQTWDCGKDQTCANAQVAHTQVCECTLPPGWSVRSKPTHVCTDLEALLKSPDCIPYTCLEFDRPAADGGQWTGKFCQLP